MFRRCVRILESSQQSGLITKSLREASKGGAQVVGLDLSESDELRCTNLMCEHVGERCACRLALWFYRNELPNLRSLNLRGNDLRTIPDPICNILTLTELDLSNNKIEHIPDTLAQLTNLEKLDLRGNANLLDIPDFVFSTFPRMQQVAFDKKRAV